jgi:hypothetical protein
MAAGGTTPQITLATTGAVTLTGALNGTSATFTGNVQGDFFTVGTTAATSGGIRLGTQVAIRARNVANTANIPLIESTASDGVSVSNGALILASTGAATFSSSVTANGVIKLLTASNGTNAINFGTSAVNYHTITYDDSTGKLTFNTDSSRIVSFLNSNVGIGTASPSYKLQAVNTTTGDAVAAFQNTITSGYSGAHFLNNSGTIIGHFGYANASVSGPLADLVYFGSIASKSVVFTTADTERMRITSTGNVGIGTDSPASTLDVIGGVRGRDFRVTNSIDNSAVGYVLRQGAWIGGGSTATNLSIAAETGNGISFFVNGSSEGPPMFLNSSGNLGIGTASPTKRLDVRASVAGEVAIVSNDRNSAGDYAFVTSLGSNCNNTSAYHYIAATGGADRVYIFGNGNIQNTNNSYGALSDAKLKENITDASPKLEDLLKVKVRNYNLIGEETKQIGVIAQELEEVFPSMIDESEDFEEVEVPQLDEEGNEVLNEEGEVITTKEKQPTGTTTKSVKYSVFVPMLIKAIQEQQEQINQLKNQINQL